MTIGTRTDVVLRDAWAAARGLRLSTCTPFCLCTLDAERVVRCRNFHPCHQFEGLDHAEVWIRNRRPVRIVSHPYGLRGVPELRAVATEWGRVVLIEPRDMRTSWYYPGSTDLVQILRDQDEARIEREVTEREHQ